ncbi:uncharacterized protein LOC123550219 [Mercenaria mercenaria]|uniref:uncharacterized protein LOC123550219 n=1 Tax=Mercenaria mercenaria TaxID=6596 RepID=UPI00234F3406|nr:uncharacterized protein LOC123550219 [Mercenaria mercenaria]
MFRMESSLGITFAVLLSCSFVLSELCEKTLDTNIKWSRHPDDCSTAYMCLLGKVVSYRCPEGHVVGLDEVTCIPAGSQFDDCTELERINLEDVEIEPMNVASSCKEGETVPDENNCAMYFECIAVADGNTTMLSQECAYPFLFDKQSRKCEHFKDVDCKPGQTVPKSPCEYKAHQCSSAHCVPCNIRFPTCTRLPDGKNPWVGREWSPDYVMCEEERVTFQGQCKSEKEPLVFHPEEKACVVYDVKTIAG